MKVNCYLINDQKLFEPIPYGEISSKWPEDELNRWIGVESADKEELSNLLGSFNGHPLILEDCLEQERSFLIVELNRPFDGLLRIPSAPCVRPFCISASRP